METEIEMTGPIGQAIQCECSAADAEGQGGLVYMANNR